MKIDIIGSYPPPYGGVSIHIKRLSDNLYKVGIKHTIYDTAALLNTNMLQNKGDNIIPISSSIKWSLRYLLHNSSDILHLNAGSSWKLRLFTCLIGLIHRKKIIITINGNDITWPYAISCLRKPDPSFIARIITKLVIYSLKHASFIICVNPDIRELVLSLGIKQNHTAVIPGFIPPLVKDKDIAQIPQNIWEFMEDHTPIIVANAFKTVFYNGQDLYGIDLCVDLCSKLKDIYPRLGFVFCISEIGDYDYFHKIEQIIEEKNLKEHFLFVTGNYQFYPILMKSQLFIRPTNTDGDALSLREALYFKVPSLASDVVSRPEGTILFKNRDINDLTQKVEGILKNYEEYKDGLKNINIEDNTLKLIAVYQGIYNQYE